MQKNKNGRNDERQKPNKSRKFSGSRRPKNSAGEDKFDGVTASISVRFNRKAGRTYYGGVGGSGDSFCTSQGSVPGQAEDWATAQALSDILTQTPDSCLLQLCGEDPALLQRILSGTHDWISKKVPRDVQVANHTDALENWLCKSVRPKFERVVRARPGDSAALRALQTLARRAMEFEVATDAAKKACHLVHDL